MQGVPAAECNAFFRNHGQSAALHRHWPVLAALIGWLASAFGLPTGAGQAWAAELVQVAPHRASALPDGDAPPLFGYLARPNGAGPFPAVVLLHWCSGFGPHDIAAAERLKSWGYVALALDSLGSENHCAAGGGAMPEAVDAYAGLHFLSQQSFVQPDRIGVVGYSMGAIAVLIAIERGSPVPRQDGTFRAAVAYYPSCAASSGIMSAPTLILIGAKDDWTPAEACQRMAAHDSDIGITRPSEGGAALKLVVYPHATHAFDRPEPPHTYLGHFMQYDAAAAQDAEMQMHAFLDTELGLPASHSSNRR